jgi:transposase
VSDELWKRIDPAIQKAYPSKPRGRHRINLRQALNGIIFRLRSGCQWNQLPKRFGDDSSVHRWFQRWSEDGFFEQLSSSDTTRMPATTSDCFNSRVHCCGFGDYSVWLFEIVAKNRLPEHRPDWGPLAVRSDCAGRSSGLTRAAS